MSFFFNQSHHNHFFLRPHLGFSLIELMVVIFIVSIISAIAIPTYQSSVRKGYRTEAMAVLEEMSQAMERYYAENLTYLGAAIGGANTGTPSSTLYATTSIPRSNNATTAYSLTIHSATINSYILRATPENLQLKDPCGTLSVTHTGARSATGGNNCW